MPRKNKAHGPENGAADGRAVAYLRTSSRTNVGEAKDSDRRQREAIAAYAGHAGLAVVREFHDVAVSGADPIDARDGFAEMLAWCRDSGVRTIIVENATRFARDLIVQETGHRLLTGAGFRLIASDSPESFLLDTPTAKLIRQVLGAVSEFEKAMTVAKLKAARDRRSAALGRRIEGRKSYAETHPELVREARRLARKSPKTGKARSLRRISAELHALGYSTARGQAFSASQVQRLLGGA